MKLFLAMDISVVVPIHNEAANITVLVREICTVLNDRHNYEVILVDDGSSDQTPELLRQLPRKYPQLRSIRHLDRCGQSTALLTGIKYAANPLIITLDGDGQNDPADMDKLLRLYKQAATESIMIIGHRRRRRDTGWRRLSSAIANRVRSHLLKDETPDTGCGLKVFSRDLFLSLPYFDHMHRFLPALVKRTGGEVLSVEVNHRPRKGGRSHYGTLDRLAVGIIDLLGVMWLMKRNKIATTVTSEPGVKSNGT
jgi:dolichol-phosphate mannosyltransferase